MQISVIGCGYLGAVHAACMADLGHEVVGIDVLAERVGRLQRGDPPFFEPGLPGLLRTALDSGRLRFSTVVGETQDATVHFICVGTPQRVDGNGAELAYVESALTDLLPHLKPGDLVVGKSTVPVGTAESLRARVRAGCPGAELVWNPEFLREGHAVADTLTPDRFVYGIARDATGDPVAVLDQVYAAALAGDTPRLVTDLATAELVKGAANSFLATKISFINTMADLCDATGADVTLLADAIGLDERIGRRFLNAGLGFGGGCLPKDIRAFMARAGELGVDQALRLLGEVDAINVQRRSRTVQLVEELCGGSVEGRRVAVLGASFKPESDDVRDSPALHVAAQLSLRGAQVTVTDPKAIENARRTFPDLRFVADVTDAVRDADLVLVLTEWSEYRQLVPAQLGDLVARRVVLDGRNCLDPAAWRAAGWTYRALGRP